ncbi:hypothetical protein F2Q68_00043809 [Brassica cretica]|uniref:Uncharacterized protein n=1 Tax=Brassica cretica TaxID=69181 RepID=A0A8S9LU38_BRACR|nr:hypothetical protein F2Q68_00043809 [Brassica cretica]
MAESKERKGATQLTLLSILLGLSQLFYELRLQVIALQARNAESNPKRFAAVIMRIREPNTDGKMILAL